MNSWKVFIIKPKWHIDEFDHSKHSDTLNEGKLDIPKNVLSKKFLLVTLLFVYVFPET